METWKRGLFVILLQLGRCFCEEAELCQPGFSSDSYVFKVTRKVLERGRVLGKVSFEDCSGRMLRPYNTEDNRVRINPDGTASLKRQLTLHAGMDTFTVHSWDASGNKFSAQILLCNDLEHTCTEDTASEKSEFPVILFPVPHSGLSRKKRDWVIPPLGVIENEKGTYPKKIAQIMSSKEKGIKGFYSVTGEGADQQPVGLFTCERNTGELFVTRPLDREQKDQYVLIAHTVSMFGMPTEDPMEIIIKVLDENDNRPVFTEELKGAVAEGAMPGTSVMTITATDEDEPQNGIVRYSIVNQEPKEPADHMFAVNKTTGVISVIASGLDKEKVRLYTLTVQATDVEIEGYATTGSVEIEVRDKDYVPIVYPKTCKSMSASHNSPLTTHVLNTASGAPAKGLQLQLSRLDGPTRKWVELTASSTNSDGRCPGIISPERFTAGTYKLRFETAEFWKQLEQSSFYPYVEVVFTILDPSQKFHVPLLLSPYSYTTYRGS